jgi:hypothetical protein
LASNESYQKINLLRRIVVSEHPTDQTSAPDAAANASGAAADVEAPKLAPEHGDATRSDSKTDAPKTDAPKVEAPRGPGKIMIMSPSRGQESWQDKSWEDKSWQQTSWQDKSWEETVNRPDPEPEHTSSGLFGRRRTSALAAVIALAAVTGALGGAMATAGLGRMLGTDDSKTASVQSRALEETIARIDADVAALKIGVERAGKQTAAQFGKTSDRLEKTADRLDKIEKAQAEPAAKLAKLSETVDKLRAPPAPVPTPVASLPAKDVTGSISAPAPAPKPEVARLPTVDGWVLREVADGGATIEGRPGIFEVFAGDPVPGLGRVDAIRKQDGRWVVVTSKGLIVAR